MLAATLIRKYQRPFTSLRDDERNRCARLLLSLFAEAAPPNSIGEAGFYGFVDCLLQSRIEYDKHLRMGPNCLLTWRKRRWNEIPSSQFSRPPSCFSELASLDLMPPPDREQQASWPQAKSFPRTIRLLA